VEARFGPNALRRLYASEVGWNLRPRGPPPNPQLKRVLDKALGKCWDAAPPQMREHLLLAALDAGSTGLGWVFGELGVSPPLLRAAVTAELHVAG
jgi:hypothetical protein